MHCSRMSDLQDYVDGELSPERAALLEQHLATCGDCRLVLANLQTVVEALETWPLVVEPAGLSTRVMARVQPRPAAPSFRLFWSDVAIGLAGSGAAAVLLAAGFGASLPGMDLLILDPKFQLHLDLLRLRGMLLAQRLSMASPAVWVLPLSALALLITLCIAVWGRASSHGTRLQINPAGQAGLG